MSVVRTLARSPVYTSVAIVTLALGIGVTTTAFTVIGSVLSKPLPFEHADQLVSVLATDQKGDSLTLSYPAFEDFRRQADVFAGFAFATGDGVTWRRAGNNTSLLAVMVTDDYFPLLHARPALGRLITAQDSRPGAAPVAVLTHDVWVAEFASDPNVIGTSLDLTLGQFTVVGVLAAGQAYPDWGHRGMLYVPIATAPYLSGKLTQRAAHVDARVLARLKDGVTREQAERQLRTIAASLAATYPATDAKYPSAALRPMRDEVVGNIGTPFTVLAAAVVLVLLLACADVANLALVRATAREREIAVRSALGAGRRELARTLLAESTLVALAGGALGVLLAFAGVRAFIAAAPYDQIPRLDEILVDWRALVVALLATSLSAWLCALAPLAVVGRGDLVAALKAGGRGSGAARRGLRLRGAIVTAQVAFSVVLITGAGLLIKSFVLLRNMKPGYDPSHLVTVGVITPANRSTDPASHLALFQRMLAAVEMPGVVSASIIHHAPILDAGGVLTQVGPDGRSPASDTSGALYQLAGARYFATMGIPIVEGRDFTDADQTAGAVPVIVSAAAARRYWPGADPLGHEITVLNGVPSDPDYKQPIRATVVAIAGDVKHGTLAEIPVPTVYVPLGHRAFYGDIVVRTEGNPASLIAPIRRAISAVDPDLAIWAIETGDAADAENLDFQRFVTTLLSIFSTVALILAALGLYGVISYAVTQRTPELGIRMALGARGADLVLLVARSAGVLVLAGLGLGAVGAFAMGRTMQSLLYGVGPFDPMTLIGVAGVLATVAALASYVPARRAARVQPVIALRAE